jgi:hypothetical protein
MKRHEKKPTYEHRLFMVIDVEDSSSRLDPRLMALRADLYQVIEKAVERTAISLTRYHQEDRGDGVLLLFDSTISKAKLVGPLLDHLATELNKKNDSKDLQDWMRLRVALNAGEVQRDRNGWGGDALTTTFRLVEAPVVKKTFAVTPRAQCIIVASNELFQAVIRHGHPLVKADEYHLVSFPLREGPTQAWVRIPGCDAPLSLPDPARTSEAGQVTIQAGTVKSIFNKKVDVRRDFNIS